jgi:hypothetical protein
MGACDFTVTAEGSTVSEAFQRVTSEARYMNGHGGYTGTIAEKHEYVELGSKPTLREALEWADELLEADDERIQDKWGPAGAIRIGNTDQWLFVGWASS